MSPEGQYLVIDTPATHPRALLPRHRSLLSDAIKPSQPSRLLHLLPFPSTHSLSPTSPHPPHPPTPSPNRPSSITPPLYPPLPFHARSERAPLMPPAAAAAAAAAVHAPVQPGAGSVDASARSGGRARVRAGGRAQQVSASPPPLPRQNPYAAAAAAHAQPHTHTHQLHHHAHHHPRMRADAPAPLVLRRANSAGRAMASAAGVAVGASGGGAAGEGAGVGAGQQKQQMQQRQQGLVGGAAGVGGAGAAGAAACCEGGGGRAHGVGSVKWDFVKTFAWITLAAIAAAIIAVVDGRKRALEFVTGYIVEYSLSVDNLFVFLLVFRFFKVPRGAQETVLFWGILGAMLLRGTMIVLGKALTDRFAWVTLGFAALLLYSAGKLLWEEDDDDEDLENNKIVRFARRVLPVSDAYCGDRFFVMESGRLLATPLMVVLVTIEFSDVVFAMDSVPAVLGISNDPLVIYASNIFAVMGLRALFFVISDAIANLRFLRQALAVVLGFIGVKMILALAGHELDVLLSLGIVVGTLFLGIVLSVLLPAPPAPADEFDPEAQLNGEASDCGLPQ